MAFNQSDRFELVSSFYGPGTTGCWYLTMLSCFISWTAHPKKRASGSIDSDFIAFLTFPAVSAGHLILQTKSFPSIDDTEESPERLLKLAASLEASLNVTETFLPFSILLLLVAVYYKCVRRALLLTVLALFSFLAEVNIDVHQPSLWNKPGLLHRLFLINYRWLILGISVLSSMLVIFSSTMISIFYLRRPLPSSINESSLERSISYGSSRRSDESAANQDLQGRSDHDFLSSRQALTISSTTFLFLPICLMASMGLIVFDAASAAPPTVWPWIRATSSRFFRNLLPRTPYSIKELDQAVAILAGATVLGFSIYGAASAQYKRRKEKRRIECQNRPQHEPIELRQLRPHTLQQQV